MRGFLVAVCVDHVSCKIIMFSFHHVFALSTCKFKEYWLENISKFCLGLLQTLSLIWFPWFPPYCHSPRFSYLTQLFWVDASLGGLPGLLTL